MLYSMLLYINAYIRILMAFPPQNFSNKIDSQRCTEFIQWFRVTHIATLSHAM